MCLVDVGNGPSSSVFTLTINFEHVNGQPKVGGNKWKYAKSGVKKMRIAQYKNFETFPVSSEKPIIIRHVCVVRVGISEAKVFLSFAWKFGHEFCLSPRFAMDSSASLFFAFSSDRFWLASLMELMVCGKSLFFGHAADMLTDTIVIFGHARWAVY